MEAEIASLQVNVQQLQHRVHDLEEQMDTFILTPWWKRLLFALDGWSLHKLQAQPQWRPWHRWTRRRFGG